MHVIRLVARDSPYYQLQVSEAARAEDKLEVARCWRRAVPGRPHRLQLPLTFKQWALNTSLPYRHLPIDPRTSVRPSSRNRPFQARQAFNTIGNLLGPFAIIPLFSTFAFSTEASFFTRPFFRHPHSPYGLACSTAAGSIYL